MNEKLHANGVSKFAEIKDGMTAESIEGITDDVVKEIVKEREKTLKASAKLGMKMAIEIIETQLKYKEYRENENLWAEGYYSGLEDAAFMIGCEIEDGDEK